MTYDIRGTPSDTFEKTSRILPRTYDMDLAHVLIQPGMFLAMAGEIHWANEIWRRTLARGVPPLRHAYGLDPLLGACAGAGMDTAPDGTTITPAEIDRVDREARLRFIPVQFTKEGLAMMEQYVPDVPYRQDARLFDLAVDHVRSSAWPRGWRETPTADELLALEDFERWFDLPDHPTTGYWRETARLVSADISERRGQRARALAHLGKWYIEALHSPGEPGSIDTGTFFQLQSLARLAATGALANMLGLSSAGCESAAKRLVEAADLRLKLGRATSPVPFDWLRFLKSLSARVLETDGLHLDAITDLQRRSGWLGQEPASDELIATAEKRLGHSLPPSYLDFLRVSNGFGPVSYFVHRLRPVEQIEWYRNEDPEGLQVWLEAIGDIDEPDDAVYRMYGDSQYAQRPRYFKNALQISDYFDGTTILLIPDSVTASGEWEIWDFAPWHPGAHRFPSFQEFMEEGTFARTE